MKVHRDTGLPQKTRKISTKQSNFREKREDIAPIK